MAVGDVVFIIGINWILSWPLAYRGYVRKLDEQLSDTETFFLEKGVFGLSVMYRAFQYASLIVFPKQMEKSYYQLTYGNFDFRAALSKQRLVIAFYYYFSSCLMLITAFVVAAHDLVFFRNTPWLT